MLGRRVDVFLVNARDVGILSHPAAETVFALARDPEELLIQLWVVIPQLVQHAFAKDG